MSPCACSLLVFVPPLVPGYYCAPLRLTEGTSYTSTEVDRRSEAQGGTPMDGCTIDNFANRKRLKPRSIIEQSK